MKERILKVGKGVLVALALVVGFSSCEKKEDAPIAMTEVSQAALPQDAQASVNSARAAGAKWCWCTDYIKNRLSLPKKADAKDMGQILIDAGYHLVENISTTNLPQNKDVIIFHADYGDPISTEYGHIAMIVSAYASGKQIRYKTVGANNHGKLKLKDEYNCSNVSISSPARALIVDKISIYRKWLSSLKKCLGVFS